MRSCPKEVPWESVWECALPNILSHLEEWINSEMKKAIDKKVLKTKIWQWHIEVFHDIDLVNNSMSDEIQL